MTIRSLFLSGLLFLSASAQAQSLYFGASVDHLAKNANCHLNASVPQLLAGSAASPGLIKLINQLNASWLKSLANAAQDYQKAITEPGACADQMSAYQADVTFSLPNGLGNNITSILYSNYAYTGGAHGGTTLAADTFNATTGELYPSLASFFDQSRLAKLKQLILSKLKEVDSNFDPTFGWDDWNAKTKSVGQITNFYVTNQGIVIYFQEYEVASYAEGLLLATLYWEDLNQLGLNHTPAAQALMAYELP